MTDRSLFSELRHRKVVQTAAIYGAVAWGVTEVIVTIVEQLFLPQWLSTLAVIFFVVGFPVAMFLAWTFDLTPEGIRRTEIRSGRGTASIAFSMLLLVAGTAGLFFLIRPDLQSEVRPTAFDIPPNSVAVLPFDYFGPDPDDNYLGPGLSDELRDQLGRVEGLGIAARSSSIAAAQKGIDARSVARSLGVAAILEGSMRREGGLLQVSVALIDGQSGLAIWNDTFKRGPRELLNVQQQIAEAVVREFLPDSDLILVKPATEDATANELMILARHYEQQALEREDLDQQLLQRAVALYREATQSDPGSALAFSRLSVAQMFLGDVDAAGVSAGKALDLDPRLAEAHNAYGKFLFATGNARMGDSLERAAKLNPNLPDALSDYAAWRWFNVGPDGVAELFEHALKRDRLNVTRYAALGRFLALNDRPAEAREVVDQVITLFGGVAAYDAIAEVLSILGEVDHSIAWTIKARDAEPDNTLHREKLAEYYIDIGDYETARDLVPEMGVGLLFKMRRFEELIDEAELLIFEYPEDAELRIFLAIAYGIVGRFEDAIRIISTSGLLDSLANAWRDPREWEGYWAVMNAALGSGEIERAQELARWWLTALYHADTTEWWQALGAACLHSVLGEDDQVYYRFQRAREGKHLVWRPMLEDAQCFKRFADDPAYRAVIEHFEDRRAMLRQRLPATLAQHGVSL